MNRIINILSVTFILSLAVGVISSCKYYQGTLFESILSACMGIFVLGYGGISTDPMPLFIRTILGISILLVALSFWGLIISNTIKLFLLIKKKKVVRGQF